MRSLLFIHRLEKKVSEIKFSHWYRGFNPPLNGSYITDSVKSGVDDESGMVEGLEIK